MNTKIIELDDIIIREKIYNIRGQKVMIDSDLAEIYGYTTKAFNQQVKNNIERFDYDFRFKLTDEEVEELSRSNFLTSIQNKGIRGGRTYNPYVFTEQGIYMLMTVLKGDLAIKQSKALIRIFKEMKDYIINGDSLEFYKNFSKLSLQVNENTREIDIIKNNMSANDEFLSIVKQLSNSVVDKEILILNGKQVESDLAYNNIYLQAKYSIYIIDNYISLKTLVLLKSIDKNIKVIIFTDNINGGLHKVEYDDFIKEYPNVSIDFKKTNGVVHDRYIILDYDTQYEKIYHCGSSSKDSGRRITTIIGSYDKTLYHNVIDGLINN